MTNVGKRLDRLEKQFGSGKHPGLRWVVCKAGWGLPLDQETSMQILGECGFLPTVFRFSIVDFCRVPDGLDAKQMERFLREHGAELCSPRGDQNDV
jgi:hypothetical protein